MSTVTFALIQCPPHQWAHAPTVGYIECSKCRERHNHGTPVYEAVMAEWATTAAAHRLAHTWGTVEAEPVAWMYGYGGGVVAVTGTRYEPGTLAALGWTETPLYAHPSPAPAEPTEARIAELEAALRERDLLIAEMIGKAAIAVALGGGPMWERFNDEAVEARTTLAGGRS